MVTTSQRIIEVRGRLLRRLVYRAWKSFAIWRASNFILTIQHECSDESALPLPTIILSTYTKMEDFLILTYLFKEHELTLLAPPNVPRSTFVDRLKSFNQVLYLGEKGVDFVFLRRLLAILRIYNRSVVISPEAGDRFVQNFSFDYSNLARIAMRANVPIQPVAIHWRDGVSSTGSRAVKKCNVFVGKRTFISPRHADFRDIFFGRRGVRKFSKLTRKELKEVGRRILEKFYKTVQYGSNLS